MFNSREEKLILAILLFAGASIVSIWWLLVLTNHILFSDYKIYYDATLRLFEGKNPYEPYRTFIYHPFVLLMIKMFSLWGYRAGPFLWSGALIIVWAWVGFSFRRLLLTLGDIPALYYWVLWFFFAPVVENIVIGQINIFVIAVLLLGFLLAEKGKSSLAGLCFALAIIFKLTPVMFLLYLVVVKQWRTILWVIIWFAFLTVITIVVLGHVVLMQYLQLMPLLSVDLALGIYNQSIVSSLYILMPKFMGVSKLLNLVQKLISVYVLFELIRVSKRAVDSAMKYRKQRFVLFVFFLMSTLLMSPLLWYHYGAYVLLPILVLAARTRRLRWLIVSVVLLLQFDRIIFMVMGVSLISSIIYWLVWFFLMQNIKKQSVLQVKT